MKSSFFFFLKSFFVFCLINSPLLAQLSGTYSVGSGGNYVTLSNAILDINSNGLSGHTTLELLNGYRQQERIQIKSYPGNDQYTLTIRPEANADSCVIYKDDAYVVEFLSARNVILDGRPGGTGAFWEAD